MVVIHSAKLPSRLAPDQLLVRPAAGQVEVGVDPADAGWRYLSFRSRALPAGRSTTVGAPRLETIMVIIGGGGAVVTTVGRGVDTGSGDRPVRLHGRRSVWDGLPSALYLPAGSHATVRPEPVDPQAPVVVAIGQAPSSGRTGVSDAPIVIEPTLSEVEVRGAGRATRQVTHIVRPEFPADRLMCVEVYTPGGNWSGWPPHKHDVDNFPDEAVLEETYFYQIRRPEGWGIQRLYRKDGSFDGIWAVRDGDLVFMPDGYHPFSAPPLYDAYYLNFLAGDRRTMANREDPDLSWVRDTFASTPVDDRVPVVESFDPETASRG